MAPRPTSIDIDRHESLTVTWDDGRVSRFALDALRAGCHCAECRSLRDRGAVVWPKPGDPQPAEIVSAERVGAWGLSVEWNDGHTTGIYTWELLRAWSEP